MINQMQILIQEINIYNTEILKSHFCDYNNDNILVRGNIAFVTFHATQVTFKNCATFSTCFTKIDEATTEDAEHLDLIIPIYDLIEYSSNYSETTGSLQLYSKDEGTGFDADIMNTNNLKPFECKAKLLGNTVAQLAQDQANRILKDAIITVSLKYVSSFWRSFEMPLTICKVK